MTSILQKADQGKWTWCSNNEVWPMVFMNFLPFGTVTVGASISTVRPSASPQPVLNRRTDLNQTWKDGFLGPITPLHEIPIRRPEKPSFQCLLLCPPPHPSSLKTFWFYFAPVWLIYSFEFLFFWVSNHFLLLKILLIIMKTASSLRFSLQLTFNSSATPRGIMQM